MSIDPETEFLDPRYAPSIVSVFGAMGIDLTEDQAQTALGWLSAEMTLKDDEERRGEP